MSESRKESGNVSSWKADVYQFYLARFFAAFISSSILRGNTTKLTMHTHTRSISTQASLYSHLDRQRQGDR